MNNFFDSKFLKIQVLDILLVHQNRDKELIRFFNIKENF